MRRQSLFIIATAWSVALSAGMYDARGTAKYRVTPNQAGVPTRPSVPTEPGGVAYLAQYKGSATMAVPEKATQTFTETMNARGYDVTPIDDTVRLPNAALNPKTSRGTDETYETGGGLFVLEFVAHPTPAWSDELSRIGIQVIAPFPELAVLASATNEQFSKARTLPYLQFAEKFRPAWKYQPPTGTGTRTYEIQLPNVPDAEADIALVKHQAIAVLHESAYDKYRNVRVVATGEQLLHLLDLPYVIGAEVYVPPSPSDERQDLAIKGISAPDGSSYLTWLSGKGITSSGLRNSDIIVGIIDMGIDTGCSSPYSHPDLVGSKAFYHLWNNEDTTGADRYTHGTLVAGIAGATGTSTTVMDGSYKYGLGVAPGVRLGAIKIFNRSGVAALGDITRWARAAVTASCGSCAYMPTAEASTCASRILNMSWNNYTNDGSYYGEYTYNSQMVDAAVRDADTVAAGDQPVAIAIAAGNYLQRDTTNSKVIPPATAKNALTMGATETSRVTRFDCTNVPKNGIAGFYRLGWVSQRTTTDFRYKPDLVAPATVTLSTRSQDDAAGTYCANDSADTNGLYTGDTGTSFAAPYGAGAMALARYYHRNVKGRGDPSPALLKAMLIASSTPLTSYPDSFDGPEYDGSPANFTVDHWPGLEAGYGLLSLKDLFDDTITKWWLDQSVILQGSTYSRTFAISNGAKPVRIAIAWTDPPGTPGGVILTNNTTLQAQFPDCSRRYFGNSTDSANNSIVFGCRVSLIDRNPNNVRVINIPANTYPTGRTFTVYVGGTQTARARQDGPAGYNQDFALFVMNAQ